MKAVSVVLVEDHTLVRHLLRAALNQLPGFEVVGEFSTAKDGIAACARLKPTLLIADWSLDDGKGIDVVRGIAKSSPATKCLILSALERGAVVREAIETGVHGFVMKRTGADLLLEAIRTVVSGKSYYCPISSRLLVEALRSNAVPNEPALTPREREILRGLARSETVKEIADRAGVSHKTIHNQLNTLRDRLGIRDNIGLVRYAAQQGLVDEF